MTEWLAMGAEWLGVWVGGGERVSEKEGGPGGTGSHQDPVYAWRGREEMELGGVWTGHWPLSQMPTPAPSQPQPELGARGPTRGLDTAGQMNKS